MFPFTVVAKHQMYLLYLDDAGSVGNPHERYLILGGIALFERQVYWLQQDLERVTRELSHPEPANLELHGNAILNRRNFWRRFGPLESRRIVRHAIATARNLLGSWALFGAVVDKTEVSPEDPVEYAFEQICNRFDRFLHRRYLNGDPQKGILIMDESAKETRLQTLATEFRHTGHRWGTLRNFSDVPMFVDSRASRAVQYADLLAYALYRKFEKGDPEFFDVIPDRFDREGNVVHGLVHFKSDAIFCDCPACAPSRQDFRSR